MRELPSSSHGYHDLQKAIEMILQDANATAMSAVCTSDRDDPAICESNHTDAPICKSNRDDLAGRKKRLHDSMRLKVIAMIAKVAKQLQWYHDACG